MPMKGYSNPEHNFIKSFTLNWRPSSPCFQWNCHYWTESHGWSWM